MRHNSARVSSSSSSTSSSVGTAGQANAPMGTARQLSVDGSSRAVSQHQQQLQQIDDSWVELRDKRLLTHSTTLNRQSLKCDVSDKTCASGDSKSSSSNVTQTLTANTNTMMTVGSSSNSAMTTATSSLLNASAQDCYGGVGVEESCLLGIDCNERTTIGLVVPILADTTIHLDGDG